MKTTLKFHYVFAVAIVGTVVTCQVSRAMPIDIATPALAHIERTDWACGPGWHIDGWGQCQRNYWGGGYGYGYTRWGGGWNGYGWRGSGYDGYPAWQGGGYYARPVWHRRWDDDDRE